MKTFKCLVLLAVLFTSMGANCGWAKAIPKQRSLSDKLQWLGPVPAKKKLQQATLILYTSAVEKIRTNVAALSEQDLLRFRCRPPEQVASTADMAAVDAYIDGLPDSQDDDAILDKLFVAAGKGNWLARLQTFAYLSPRGTTAEDTYLTVKLFAWLVEHDIGGVYSYIAQTVEASGYYSDAPGARATGIDLYAALHDGYPAQHKVGRSLLERDDDPRLISIGRSMIACAENSIPSYRRVFSGEAETLKQARKHKLLEASYSELHWAVLRDDADKVREMVRAKPDSINLLTADNRSAIELALRQPQINLVILRALIEGGAQVKNHPPIYDKKGTRSVSGLLGIAVEATAPSLEALGMLIDAGADPFNASDDYHFNSPFALAFESYERGEPAVFEYLLSTKKLNPDSERAQDYLRYSVGSRHVFDRLLDYGISPVGGSEFLELMASSGDWAQASKLNALIKRFPGLRADLVGESGRRAVVRAVDQCNFTFASVLMDSGVVLRFDEQESGESVVRTLVTKCGRTSLDDSAEQRAEHRSSRRAFVMQLSKAGANFNLMERNCPAWTGFMCAPPADDDLAELFLQLGADPYKFAPFQSDSILKPLIQDCRTQVLGKVLAKPPVNADADTLQGLNQALASARQGVWEGRDCPADFSARVSKTLMAYGATDDDGL